MKYNNFFQTIGTSNLTPTAGSRQSYFAHNVGN